MFIGEYLYSIDDKKRLAIPAKFRKALGKKAVLTRGIDNCLVLYTKDEWESLRKQGRFHSRVTQEIIWVYVRENIT